MKTIIEQKKIVSGLAVYSRKPTISLIFSYKSLYVPKKQRYYLLLGLIVH